MIKKYAGNAKILPMYNYITFVLHSDEGAIKKLRCDMSANENWVII